MSTWARTTTGRPWLIMLLVVALSVLAASSGRSLQISSVTDGLVIPEEPAARSGTSAFTRNAGLVVLVDVPDRFSAPAFRRDLAAASSAIEKIEAVASTMDLSKIQVPDTRRLVPPTVFLLDKYAPAEQDLLVRELRFLSANNLLSEDLGTVLIHVRMTSASLSDSESIKLVNDLRARLDPFDFDYQLVGQAVVREALVTAAIKDTLNAMAVTAIITMLILFALYRSLFLTLLPLFTSAVAILFTGGMMAAADIPLNNLTVLIAPLLVVINVASSIHVITEFQRICASGAGRAQAASHALERKLKPCLLAALTTSAGFLALALSNTPVLVDFALAAGCGVMFGFFLTVSLLPACLSLNLSRHRCVAHTGAMTHLVGWISKTRVTLVLIIALPLVAAAVIGANRLTSDTVIMDVFSDAHPIVIAQNQARDITGGLTFLDLSIHAPEQSFSQLGALNWVDALTRVLRDHPSVVEVLSLSVFMAKTNAYYERKPFGPEILPESQRRLDQLLRLLKKNTDSVTLDNLVTRDFSSTRLLIQAKTEGSNALIQLHADLQQMIEQGVETPLSFTLDNTELAYARAVNHVVDDQIRSFTLVIAGIVIVTLLAFRSLTLTLLALLCNMAPVAAVFGLMGWLGIQLDFFNVMVACIALGIVIDDSMHLLSQYVRSGRRDLAGSLQQVGTAIIVTSLVLIVGFCGIAASASLAGTGRFALLTALAVLFALFATLWLLPALLSLTHRARG